MTPVIKETDFPELVEIYNTKGRRVHFAPPSGHRCVCQRALGGAKCSKYESMKVFL